MRKECRENYCAVAQDGVVNEPHPSAGADVKFRNRVYPENIRCYHRLFFPKESLGQRPTKGMPKPARRPDIGLALLAMHLIKKRLEFTLSP